MYPTEDAMRGRLVRWFLFFAVVGFHTAAHAQNAVVVNGVALDKQTIAALQRAYGAVQPGRYWYDPVSGLYGAERGPTAGQIAPGLRLGGPLRADASGRGTGVFVNGRELHPAEVVRLRALFGVVLPGRYWMNAAGIGGFEGAPAHFSLAAAAAQRGGGGGGGGYNRSGPGGHLMSDGNCSGWFDPKSGASVMTGNC
jgi:hypothetical protein